MPRKPRPGRAAPAPAAGAASARRAALKASPPAEPELPPAGDEADDDEAAEPLVAPAAGAPALHALVVPPEAQGERLDAHLARALPALTRSRLQGLIEAGRVQVDGRPAKAAQRLRGGEALRVEVPAPVAALPQPEDLPLHVLYEDKDLLVVDKAPGMVVHPGAGHASGTLVNALLFRVKDLAGVGGELRPGIVHRLDKDTSGCIVVAKHERALHGLQQAFRTRAVEKTYLALVYGRPPPQGRIETPFGRHPVHRQRFSGRVREGKHALTEYRVVEAFEDAALVEVALHTGRTHQIRVHLSELGHPLLGDALYGGGAKRKGPAWRVATELGRQALHAWRLALPPPRTGKALRFEAPLPADLEAALAALRAGA